MPPNQHKITTCAIIFTYKKKKNKNKSKVSLIKKEKYVRNILILAKIVVTISNFENDLLLSYYFI